jgi:hypothetical protein
MRRKLTQKEKRARERARLLARARRIIAQAGGRARWAGTTAEQRSDAMRALAVERHRKDKDDAGSTS